MNLIKLIFAIVSLFLPHTVTAASWYQVEVIVLTDYIRIWMVSSGKMKNLKCETIWSSWSQQQQY